MKDLSAAIESKNRYMQPALQDETENESAELCLAGNSRTEIRAP